MQNALLVIACLTGCLSDSLVECDDGRLCPTGTVCDLVHAGCVTPAQTVACTGHLDGDVCDADGTPGICDRSYCISGCGDGAHDAGEECDDGNFRSHDGCSSQCLSEVASWFKWQSPWVGRAGHAAALHAASAQLVLFGGHDGSDVLGDQWHVDASEVWTHSVPSMSPRRGAAVAYDPVRQRIVMFGGTTALGATLADTWEFDGTAWSQRITAASPPARSGAAMAFDVDRSRIVLFGGEANVLEVYGDTWEYDGISWQQVVTSPTPEARVHHAMAWDATRQRAILFGGKTIADSFGDIWEYAGGTWTKSTVTGPAARYGHSMAYWPAAGGIVLFGGFLADTTPLADTWAFDGVWTQQTGTGVLPSPRGGASFTAAGDDLILIGGTTAEGPRDDVWAFGASTGWRRASPIASPASREGNMVFDPQSRMAVLLGGYGGGFPRDVWGFRDQRWQKLPTDMPEGRFFHSVSHDVSRRRVLVFGGTRTSDFTTTSDMLQLDLVNLSWTTVATPVRPPPRTNAATAYDSKRGVTVLFGGMSGSTVLDDTWELDGSTWSAISPTTSPPGQTLPAIAYDPIVDRVILFGLDGTTWSYAARSWTLLAPASEPVIRDGASLVYNPQRRRVTLYGGIGVAGALTDVWELDDTTWQRVETIGSAPPARLERALIANEQTRALMMFGGFTALQQFGDTWFLQHRSLTPEENCENAIDDDHDNHVDDRDPDCQP